MERRVRGRSAASVHARRPTRSRARSPCPGLAPHPHPYPPRLAGRPPVSRWRARL